MGMVVGLFLSIAQDGIASGVATTASPILNLGVGARAIAMGEAYTAVADDSSSLYWNPAGLAIMNQSQASFMYNQSFQDMNFSNLSLATITEHGGLGGSISYLGYGDIDGFDNAGNPTGNVNAYSGYATFGGAYLGDLWSAGASIKGIQGTLADVTARGVAFDLGTNVIYPHEVLGGATLRFAAAVRNLGPSMSYLDQKDPMPTDLRLGSSLLRLFDGKLNASVDYSKMRDMKSAFYMGGEYWLVPMLALRTGYTTKDQEGNGIRAGIGLKIHDLSFDYAYINYGDLGMAHRYEMTYRFGAIRPFLTPEMRKMLKRAKADIRNGDFAEASLLMDALLKMAPNYHEFQRLAKVAMMGYQEQEQYAKNEGKYKYSGQNMKPGKVDPYDAKDETDLTELLSLTETNNVQASVPNQEKKK